MINCKPSTLEEIYKCFNHECMNRIKFDNKIFQPIFIKNILYFSFFNDNEFLGIYIIEIKKSYSELHMMMLPNSIPYIRQTSKIIICTMLAKYRKIKIKILEENYTTRNLALKMGFKFKKMVNAYKQNNCKKLFAIYEMRNK